jgi:hypothetical protein
MSEDGREISRLECCGNCKHFEKDTCPFEEEIFWATSAYTDGSEIVYPKGNRICKSYKRDTKIRGPVARRRTT